MKEYLNGIQEKLVVGSLITQEIVDLIGRLIANTINLYDVTDSKLKATTKLSISRKLKLNLLYLKIDSLNTLQLKYDSVISLNLKLAKYRLVAVKEKLNINFKIKTLFDVKLSDTANKDYNKYHLLYSQFDFLSTTLLAYDKNKRTYDLLLLAGTFGLNTISKMQTLPKSGKGNLKSSTG